MPRRKRADRKAAGDGELVGDGGAGGGGAAAAPAAAEAPWECDTCTFSNAAASADCEMCEMTRPVDGVAYFGGCDEVFRGVRVSDGEEVLSTPAGGNG